MDVFSLKELRRGFFYKLLLIDSRTDTGKDKFLFNIENCTMPEFDKYFLIRVY